MKIAVLPDAAMLFVHLITKNGHEYLSSTNICEDELISKDSSGSDDNFDYSKPPFNMDGYTKLSGLNYVSSELPSGVVGRLSLSDNIIQNAEAAIILNEDSVCEHMYDTLNELILFGCISCKNHYEVVKFELKSRNIPILELDFPTSRDDLIEIINKTNKFLQDLNNDDIVLQNNLGNDHKMHDKKMELNIFKEIIDRSE